MRCELLVEPPTLPNATRSTTHANLSDLFVTIVGAPVDHQSHRAISVDDFAAMLRFCYLYHFPHIITAWKIAIYLDLDKSYSWVPNTIMLEVRRRLLAHPAYIEERRRQFECRALFSARAPILEVVAEPRRAAASNDA